MNFFFHLPSIDVFSTKTQDSLSLSLSQVSNYFQLFGIFFAIHNRKLGAMQTIDIDENIYLESMDLGISRKGADFQKKMKSLSFFSFRSNKLIL